MKRTLQLKPWRRSTALALLALFTFALGGCSKSQSGSAKQGNLDDAIKARTEAVAQRQEVATTVVDQLTREIGGEREATKVIKALRKVMAKAESKQEEGNILLTKDRYADAAEAYNEAVKLYGQALDWRKVQKNLTKAEQGAATARLLAEAAGKTNQIAAAKSLQVNAEGYLEAGELDKALAEYAKAQKAFEALIPGAGAATLEQAIAARTAMQAARDQIKDLSRLPLVRRTTDAEKDGKGPKPGSLPDVLGRAQKAEAAAAEGLEDRQYSSARALFAAAEKLYQEAAALQTRRDAVAASRKSVEDSMNLADKAFKGSARPASFERGKQALADADKALADDDLETAKPLLTSAAEQFAAGRAEADQMNALGDAQQAWAAALAAADEDLLTKHVAGEFQAAKGKAADAQAKASTALFTEATTALKDAVASAKTKENTAKAAPVIARLESALAGRDKFRAEAILTELEQLIPADARMSGLREKAKALPWAKETALDLGGGVKMEFVLIRPGSFTMGSDKASDEKPAHKVTITKPFYLGKYEVTQEQWEKVMGSNPSNFKGPKLPVEQVSWNDCQSFVAKLKEKLSGYEFGLPSEAQWEYACRAGTSTDYGFGDGDARLGEYGWYSSNSESKTHPVGEKKPNAWGLYDMHGNVWEWCSDAYGSYSSEAVSDPTGASSGNRVLRGGSWYGDSSPLRSAYRGNFTPDSRYYGFGLRCVVVVSESAR
jgi:formylglycine-generating enzyme required for sulfatase activity